MGRGCRLGLRRIYGMAWVVWSSDLLVGLYLYTHMLSVLEHRA